MYFDLGTSRVYTENKGKNQLWVGDCVQARSYQMYKRETRILDQFL